jgi:hypothetical protein
MQGKISHTKNQNISNIQRKTTTHRILHTNNMAGKSNFTLENILMYNPQRDKALSTSKKEVRNDGTCS